MELGKEIQLWGSGDFIIMQGFPNISCEVNMEIENAKISMLTSFGSIKIRIEEE